MELGIKKSDEFSFKGKEKVLRNMILLMEEMDWPPPASN